MQRTTTAGLLVLAGQLACAAILCAGEGERPAPPSAAAATVTASTSRDPSNSQTPVVVPEPSEKALSFYRSGNVLWVVGNLWGLIVPAGLLFSGLSARLRDLAWRLGGRRFASTIVYTILLVLTLFVLDLPLRYYSEFVRQHAYGLSNQTLAKWAGDGLKSLMVSCVVSSIVVLGIFLFLRKSPRRWWLWMGMAAVPFLAVMLLVAPVWIDPLFNPFGPLKDKALEANILALARRAGIEGGRVFEVEKSVDTNAVNAYVTGFGATKRIVLWDTIIAKLDRRELGVVMGHEMGHYVLGHVRRTIVFFSLGTALILYAVHRTAGAFIRRWRARIGFSELSDLAALPLIMLLAGLASLLAAPVGLGYSRWQERQADRFGLEITRDNHAAAMAFVKLQAENLSVPRHGWLYTLWRSSHPSIGDRIDFCNTYRPWEAGRPGTYEHLFEASVP